MELDTNTWTTKIVPQLSNLENASWMRRVNEITLEMWTVDEYNSRIAFTFANI